MRLRTILTLSVTAAALIMKSLTDTFICSEKEKQYEVMLTNGEKNLYSVTPVQ